MGSSSARVYLSPELWCTSLILKPNSRITKTLEFPLQSEVLSERLMSFVFSDTGEFIEPGKSAVKTYKLLGISKIGWRGTLGTIALTFPPLPGESDRAVREIEVQPDCVLLVAGQRGMQIINRMPLDPGQVLEFSTLLETELEKRKTDGATAQ